MPFGKALVAILLVTALAGCSPANRGAGLLRPDLPVLPSNLASTCRDPGVRSGQPVINEFARNRQALAECARKQRDLVNFYDGTRAGLAGK